MKKTLLLTIALLLSTAMYAQSRTVLLNETFDSMTMPEGWSIIGDGIENWHMSETNNAGGEACEIYLHYHPIFYFGQSRLTTPPIDLTGISSVTVSFKHYFDNFSTWVSSLGIATSSDNGNTWNTAWTQEYSTDGQYSINQVVATDDMGKDNVMFCIYFDGSTSNIDYWYFDDISISTETELDLELVSNDMQNDLATGDNEVVFTVHNLGGESITSFEARYEIGDISISETFSVDMAQFESQQLTFENKANLLPGNYNVKIEILSVNGGDDGNLSNNVIEKEINVALGVTQRIPMIEHFSSSTCVPCVGINGQMHQLTENNPGKFAYTKYPTDIPGLGDPYYTAEVEIRKNYYNVNSVPQVIFNGTNLGSSALSQYQLDESYNTNAHVNIKGAFDIEGSTIDVTVDVMSFIDIDNAKMFASVNEKHTTGNASSNGETDFYHIMMKMLGDANGNDISLKAGEYQRFEFTCDMSQTHVEEMNDLEVAVWIQNNTKEIFNGSFLYEYTGHKYPAQNLKMTENGDAIDVTWEAPEEGEPSGYDVYINNSLVLDNTSELFYSFEKTSDFYVAEVVALYEEMESVGIVTTEVNEVSTEETISDEQSFTVYPNPAKDFVKVSTDNGQQTTVKIYNTVGMLVGTRLATSATNEIEINVSEYNPGIYFINISNEEYNVTKKIVIE